ncbi:hypothetical protein GQ44DRAFT_767637 [Phaeosphaeriaceae sp. PMI808]|nr:hypothetical protein GQ44DRAFT_767637 [Phaeosphaeriaceae sp. PMI808]
MATRRAHNKSRLGCHQCKRRRIKCDAKQPSCANCDKKSLECSFLLLAPATRLSIFSSTTSPKASEAFTTPPPACFKSESSNSPISISSHLSSPSSDLSIVSQTLFDRSESPTEDGSTHNSTEAHNPALPHIPVRLALHPKPAIPSLRSILSHYEYTTSLTLAPNDPAKAAWQTYLPEIASNHDFLVNCVLSVASLHLGRLHTNQDEKKRMHAVAASRMNKALTRYRPELAHVTQQNAAALFASVTLTSVYLFRTAAIDIEELIAQIPQGTVVPPQDIIDKMMACALRPIWGLRGPLAVLMSGWTWVTGGKMQAVTARNWWPSTITPATARAVEEDERLSQLESLWTHRVGSDCVYLTQALGFLRESFALISQLTLPETYPPMTAVPYSIDDETTAVLTDRGAIFVWAARISRDFIQLIEAMDRDALVILAYYAVLPGRVRNVWWLEGLGADIVTAIAMALGQQNWALIAWPASVVGVDLDNIFSARKNQLGGRCEDMGMMGMEVI